MKSKFIRKTKGAIAVFLSLIMLSMVVFEGLLIDTSRIIAAKTVTSGAGDLALNAALTDYDKVLYEVYGLFASASNGNDLNEKINDYFNRTLQGAGIDGSMEDVSNLLNLMVTSGGSVSLSGVNGSQLSNEDVIEEQILQYMKFRAPVNIGFGFIEKLESFKDFNKQSEAMEAQMTFEEKLESIQDVCQNVYDKSNDLKNKDVSQITDAGQALHYGMINTQLAVEGLSKLYKKAEDVNKYSYTDNPNNANGKSVDNWSNKEGDFRHCFTEEYIGKFIDFIKDENTSGNNFSNTYYFAKQLNDDFESYKATCSMNPGSGLPGFSGDVCTYIDDAGRNIQSIRELYFVLSHYDAWYMKMVYKEDSSISEEKLDEYKEFNKLYKNKISEKQIYLENNNITKKYQEAVDIYINCLNIYYLQNQLKKNIEAGVNAAEDGIEKADALIKAIDCGNHSSNEESFCCLVRGISVSEKYKNTWNTKIEALGDSTSKSSMKSTYESEASGIDSAKYEQLLATAREAKTYYEAFKKYFEGICLCDTQGEHAIYSDNIQSWESVVDNYEDNGNNKDVIFTKKEQYPASLNPSTKEKIESDSFYQYLQNICNETKKNEGTPDKQDAEDNRDELFDKGKEKAEVSGEIKSVDASAWKIADKLFENTGSDTPNDTSVSKGSKNKDTTKNAKNSLKATKKLLNNVEKILTNARDSIYITEYTTGMFSCYTTGVKEAAEAGEAVELYTIAGNDKEYNLLSEEHNRLWRAEQEYVLWGDKNSVNDVNNTMTAIFGIRFALNLLYAFTGDVEIEATTLAWATAIAGWTGFGVPIVQTVLKIAFALAESVYDISVLKKGEDLVIYKSVETWAMKPSSIAKIGVEKVADKAASEATGLIDSAFNYVDQITVDKIDDVQASVSKTVENTQKSIVGSAVDYVFAPFSATFVSLVGRCDTDTKQELNRILESTKNNVNENTTLGKLEKYLIENYGGQIVEKLSNEINSVKNGAVTSYDQVVNDLKKELMEKASASEIVNNMGNELKETVSNTLQGLNENTQEAVGDAVNNAVSDFINKSQGYGNADSASVTRGFALTMNYQEYVHMFLILKGIGNNTKYLNRVAQLIQLNMETRKQSFDLRKKYTLLQLNAEVQVNTTFFGKLDSFLDNPLNAKDTYTLKYCGLQGY